MPYPNEHAFRMESPKKYKRIRRENDKFGKGIHAIWGVLEVDGKETTELQAIRFDADKWTYAKAKKWVKEHDYKPIESEKATGESRQWLERGKALEELAKGSLEYTADMIRTAFRKQFNPTDSYPFPLWVNEIFSDHVIVSEYPSEKLAPDEYFQVAYEKGEAGYTFAGREEWKIVELAYQPQSPSMGERNRTEKGKRGKRLEERVDGPRVELLETAEDGKTRRIRINGLMTAGVVNGNGRRYPFSVLEAAVAGWRTHLHESAGQGRLRILTGEADHPADKGNKRPQYLETVVKWTDIEMNEGRVDVIGDLVLTSKGKDVATLMEAGVLPGGSVRGYYDAESKKENGRTVEEVTWCEITGADLVGDPSFDNVADLLESQHQGDDKMEPEELKKMIGEHPDWFKGMIEGELTERVKAMGVEQLKTLEESIRKALGLEAGADLGKALKEMAEAKRKLDDAEKAKAVETAIAEQTKDLPYGDLNGAFIEAVKGAGLTMPEAVKSFVEAKRKEYDAIVSKAKLVSMGFPHVKVLGPVLERETGVPAFARGAHEFHEAMAVRGYVPRRDLRTPKTLNEEYTARVLKRFDECYKAQLLAEAKQLDEAGEVSTDLSLPYSVSRAVVAALFPQLVSVSVFDFGVTDVSPFLLYFETSAKETGLDGTVSNENPVLADVGTTWASLSYKRLKPGTVTVKNSVGGTAGGTITYTEGTDYVIDYANGKLLALTGGGISAGTVNIAYQYLAIRKGENVAIERAKTTLASKTLTAAADRLATLITSEAVTFSRSQIGWDATTRTLANLIAEMRRKIDEGIFYAAITASLRTASNCGGTFSLATAGTALQNLVNYIGASRVKVAKRFYRPSGVVLSTSNSDTLANWTGFTQAGSRADANLNAEGYVGSIKGLPCFQSTEFPDTYVLVVNRELVAHRVYQPVALKGPFPTYSDGQLVAADQYFAEEYNATDVPVADKGSHVLITA